MKASVRKHLVAELGDVMTSRLLWAVLPASHVLGIQGEDGLSEMVTWAVRNVAEDVDQILSRYGIS